MILTQRLILLGIIINICAGFVATIAEDPTIVDMSPIQNEINVSMALFNQSKDREAQKSPGESTQYEPTFGNKVRWGKLVWRMLVNGINPLLPDEFQTGDTFEQIVIIGVEMFRVMFGLLLVAEVFLVFVNKKYG